MRAGIRAVDTYSPGQSRQAIYWETVGMPYQQYPGLQAWSRYNARALQEYYARVWGTWPGVVRIDTFYRNGAGEIVAYEPVTPPWSYG